MNSLIFHSAVSASGSFVKRNKVAASFAGKRVWAAFVANASKRTENE
jgi:hypothetical protein